MGDNEYVGIERRQGPQLEPRVRDLEENFRNVQKSLPRVHERVSAVNTSMKEGFEKLDKKLDSFTENCAKHRVETAELKTAHEGLEKFVKWSTGIYYAASAAIAGILWHSKK